MKTSFKIDFKPPTNINIITQKTNVHYQIIFKTFSEKKSCLRQFFTCFFLGFTFYVSCQIKNL